MKRLVGIDYGRKRVGLAVSDPLGIFASPLETIPSAKIIDYLKEYTLKNEVAGFIVGKPMNLDNRPAECMKYLEPFLKHLSRTFPDIPVIMEDERFTSVLAMQSMIDGGMKKKDRQDKSNVDKISAAIILQSYMDRRK